MIVLQIVGLIFWLIIIPFCMGLLPAGLLKEEKRKPSITMIAGYIVMFAVFEIIAIPSIIFTTYHGFTILTRWFCVVSLLLAAGGVGITCMLRRKGQWKYLFPGRDNKAMKMDEKIMWILFAGVFVFQLYMAFTRASFDGDDAYYVVHSLTAQQLDTMYRNNPNLGRSAPLDVRHCLAAFPMWIAYVGRMSGIHSTIVSHSIMPLVSLSVTYLLFYQIGGQLLSKKKDMLPMFMVVISLIQMFGNVSIYTSETFLMTRSWQGKSWTASFFLPLVICIFLWIFKEKDRHSDRSSDSTRRFVLSKDTFFWILLALTGWAAGIASSLAVFLCVMLIAATAFFMTIRERKLSILIKAGAACIPSGIYVLIYLLLLYIY